MKLVEGHVCVVLIEIESSFLKAPKILEAPKKERKGEGCGEVGLAFACIRPLHVHMHDDA